MSRFDVGITPTNEGINECEVQRMAPHPPFVDSFIRWEKTKAHAPRIYNPRFITAHLYPPIYNQLIRSSLPCPSLIRGSALPSVGQAET